MAREYSPIWPILDQTVGARKEKEKEEEEESRERGSTFSLNFWVIGSSSSSGARGKALPRKERFATRPELRSFDKLREVGVFSYLVYSLAKSHPNG